jgi:hypothetical protein
MSLLKLKNISFYSRFCLLGLLFLLNACTELKKAVIHNYPKETAFVYNNIISIHDAPSKKIKKTIQLELEHYWDDSLKAKYIRQFGFFNTLVQPVYFQADRIPRSVNYMQAYLASQGYNHAQLIPSFNIDTIKREYRTTVIMDLRLNLKTLIDTVTYSISDPSLQKIAQNAIAKAYIKKNTPFSNQIINNELDRLVELFRSNGYYYFTKEKIFAEIDTLDQSLMQLNLDPLKQIDQVLTATNKETENPRWKVNIQLRNTNPSNIKTYPVGQQIFYSDLNLNDNPDSIIIQKMPTEIAYKSVLHAFRKPKFKTSLFEEQSMIQIGDLYNEKKFYQTLNNFSSLGAWQQIDARSTIHNDSVYLHYLLVPSLRRSISMDLEGSKNSAQLGGGNLLGLSTSLTYRDKNVQKKSIPSITSIRSGVELNLNNNQDNLTQTLLWNVGHTYSFPNILIPFVPHQHAKNYSTRSNFALNGSSIDRLNYYQLKSFTTSWGYEWKNAINSSENAIIYKPINIELYKLNKFSKLDSLLLLNPFLRSSFNDGNVMSQTFTFLHAGPSKHFSNHNNYLRVGIEEAGAITNLIPGLKKNIYTFIKAELELRKAIKYENSELAMRFLSGWGNNYSNDAKLGGQLPFFKQFTAGGPYSMRAWGLRQLGLGSSQFYDTSRSSQNFDRFGDLQLEANLEYRFDLLQWGNYKIGSAVFIDMGNIWNTRDTKADPAAGFKLDRLYKDLAIGMGSGLRFDFNYFIIRIDYAIKMKDPTRSNNNGWMDLKNIKWSETKPNGIRVNNYAWQFGIGLPF